MLRRRVDEFTSQTKSPIGCKILLINLIWLINKKYFRRLNSTGVKRVIDGNLEIVGKGNEGKLSVKYSTTPISTETTLTILDTDYDSYAVVWNCNGFGPIHARKLIQT